MLQYLRQPVEFEVKAEKARVDGKFMAAALNRGRDERTKEDAKASHEIVEEQHAAQLGMTRAGKEYLDSLFGQLKEQQSAQPKKKANNEQSPQKPA